MSIARHSRRSRRSFILAAAAILGVGPGASLAAVTPADAGRLQLTARQAKHPRKTVKLPTRPSPRANGVRADRVQARPGRGNADRVRLALVAATRTVCGLVLVAIASRSRAFAISASSDRGAEADSAVCGRNACLSQGPRCCQGQPRSLQDGVPIKSAGAWAMDRPLA